MALLLGWAAMAPIGVQAQEGEGTEEAAEEDPAAGFREFIAGIEWIEGPGVGAVGDQGQLKVPASYRFTGQAGTKLLMERTGNLVDGSEKAFLSPADNADWFVVFEWEASGYVKDDEKGDLDAKALLDSLKEGTEASNEERKKLGYPPIHVVGWEVPPRYDETTKNLEWAIRLQSDTGGVSVNYNTRLLGREGVMKVNLVTPPEAMQTVLPEFKNVVAGYTFTPGHLYSEYRQGDRVAEYGLAALILGGGAAAAAKSGLLAKLGKGAIKLIVVAAAGVAALVRKLFGKKAEA